MEHNELYLKRLTWTSMGERHNVFKTDVSDHNVIACLKERTVFVRRPADIAP